MHTYLNQRSLLLHEIKQKKSGKTEYIRTHSKYFYIERANWVKGGKGTKPREDFCSLPNVFRLDLDSS